MSQTVLEVDLSKWDKTKGIDMSLTVFTEEEARQKLCPFLSRMEGGALRKCIGSDCMQFTRVSLANDKGEPKYHCGMTRL